MTDDDADTENSPDPFDETDGNPFDEADERLFEAEGEGTPEPEGQDPFEEFEADVRDRQGDPFDRLEEETETGESASESEPVEAKSAETTMDVEEPTGWTFPGPDRTDSGRSSDGTVTAPESTDPLTDIEREGDPFDNIGGAFEQMNVGDVDPERVWQDLASAESRGSVGNTGRIYAEVSKHAYCEQCPFLSDPPHIDCHHDGTEIVEFLDMETVRVVDCPVVAEREALENE